MDEVTEIAAQQAEAAASAEVEPIKIKTKTVTWQGRTWQIRSTPGGRFVDQYEQEHLMGAARAVLGEKQYSDLLDMDPDLTGDDGMDGFFKQCNKAWGLTPGN